MCRASSLPAFTLPAIPIPFRGRNIYVAGDRTFDDPWTTTFLNDTAGVIVGPGEALIMPADPANPLWNASCSGCTDPAASNYDPTATIDNGTCVYSNSVYDIVSNSVDHTTLKAAVDACALDGVLSGTGPLTLFAPTDALCFFISSSLEMMYSRTS